MKKIVVPAFVILAVAAGLAWFVLAPRQAAIEPPAPAPAATAPAPAKPGTSTTKAAGDAAAPLTSESAAASAGVPVGAPAGAPAGDTENAVVLLGRVVDPDGSPLPLASVRLLSHKELAKPAISTLDVTADERGRFRVQVADLDVAELSLVLTSDDHHARETIRLRSTLARVNRALRAGENDLGDLALRVAGSIEGTVRDSAGNALARIGVFPQVPDFGNSSPFTDANGRFFVSRIPPGKWTIRALASGWITGELAGVEVRPRETTRGLEIVLAPGNVLAGRVVDSLGRAVPDASLSALPVGGGNGGAATSRADGSFTLPLAAAGEHFVSARAKGYLEYGGVNDRRRFAADAKDVEIVLEKAVVTTFVVLDEASAAPIERYELSVQPRATSPGQLLASAQPRPESDVHPRGECAIEADPARYVVRVRAKGYAPLEADVRHESPADARQVLRLRPGGAVTGRALLNGAPAAAGRATIARGLVVRERPKPLSGEDDGFPITSTYQDLTEFEGRPREVAFGADGTFRIEDLATGTYDLTLRAAGAAARTARGVKIEAPRVLELGDVALQPGATIHGRVVVGPGQSPIGLTVDAGTDGPAARVERADGAFDLADVTPGTVALTVARHPPLVLEDLHSQHEVQAGAANEIVLDLTPFLPATLEVTVRENGAPVPGLALDWIAVRSDGRIERTSGIGTTDADGRARAVCPGGRRLVVRARLGDGLVLGSSGAPTLVAGGKAHAITIDLARGDLVIQFPAEKPVPIPGKFTLTLTPVTPDVRDLMTIQRTTPAPGTAPTERSWTSARVELGSLAAGDYEVRLTTLALSGSGDGPWIAPWSERITVAAGRTTTIEPR